MSDPRKDRTRNLIQIGALTAKYLRCEGQEPQEVEKLLKRIAELANVREVLESEKQKT